MWIPMIIPITGSVFLIRGLHCFISDLEPLSRTPATRTGRPEASVASIGGGVRDSRCRV